LGAIEVVRSATTPEGRSAAAELVGGLFRTDWRWDAVDDRALYLARLVGELGLPLEPLTALLIAPGADTPYRWEQASDVLELLARGGSEQAREALRTYVARGEHWQDVLVTLAAGWPVEWWDDLAMVASSRLAGEEPDLWRSEPWVRWRERGTLTTAGTRTRATRPRVGRPGKALPELTGGQLLALLADPGKPDRVKTGALRELSGRPPEPGLIPLVSSLRSSTGLPQGPSGQEELPLPLLGAAVRALGPLAVPAARAWAVDRRGWLAWIGCTVLAAHGTERDLPFLVVKLAGMWARGEWCGPSRVAEGLARFGPLAAEAVPVLRRFWLWTPHSYERPACLRALAAIDPSGPGLDRAYAESVWDCEAAARLLGVASGPDRPEARADLARLRDDPMEEPEVRSAAGQRLVELTELTELTEPGGAGR
jgi:hypothetical protein